MFGIVIRNIFLFVEYLSLFYAVFCREFRKSKLNKIWIIIVSALVFSYPVPAEGGYEVKTVRIDCGYDTGHMEFASVDE